MTTSPRVGLTLKRYDLEKEKYMLADYRFLTYPEKCKKQNILIQIALLAKGEKPCDVQTITGGGSLKSLDPLLNMIKKARLEAKACDKPSLKKYYSDKLNSETYAKLYGVHQIVNNLR